MAICGQSSSSRLGRSAGFTLIELMVTVAIIAILATIAVSSYQWAVIKARRNAAASCLQEGAQYMERFRTINMSYLNAAGAAPSLPACSADVSNFYAVSLSDVTATAFKVSAVPVTGKSQARDAKCATLAIDQVGRRTASGTSASSPGDCW